MEKEPTDPPKEIEDKPELLLLWRGLQISISEGMMTRRQAYAMIKRWEDESPQEGADDAVHHNQEG